MKATADLQVIPIGKGVSVRKEIMQVVDLLAQYPFKMIHHAAGTNIEGELDLIFEGVSKVHEMLHLSGTVRIVSQLKIETRTDKVPSLEGKRLTDIRE